MTTIERLGIQGIRSYGPEQEQVGPPGPRRAPSRSRGLGAGCVLCVSRAPDKHHLSHEDARQNERRGRRAEWLARCRLLQLADKLPDAAQAITFTPPLTLILGPNGSGKTTVIEVSLQLLSRLDVTLSALAYCVHDGPRHLCLCPLSLYLARDR